MRPAREFRTGRESVWQNQPPRFQNIKCKQLEFDAVSIPSILHLLLYPPELQLKLLKMQNNDMPKVMYLNKPLLEFLRVYIPKEEFSNLKAYALNGHWFPEARTYATNFLKIEYHKKLS